MGASLLFILMNLIPHDCGGCFSLVLSEVNSLGEFFQKVFLQKESPYPGSSILHPSHLLWDFHPAHECSLLGTPSWPSSIFPWTLLYGGLEEVGWRWFYKIIFPLVSTLY